MNRPLVVCTMALLAAAGVAQVPLHWDFPTTPKAVQLPVSKAAETNIAPVALATLSRVDVPAIEPRHDALTASPSAAAVALPQQDNPALKPPGGMRSIEPAVAPQVARQKVAQASGLPPPPRNSDVPPPRHDPQNNALQPAPAVPQVQLPVVQVSAAKPPRAVPQGRSRPTLGKPFAKVEPAVAKAVLRPAAQPRNIPLRNAPPVETRRMMPTQAVVRLKPVPMRMVSLPPLAYAYAPAPRLNPPARRAPQARVQ